MILSVESSIPTFKAVHFHAGLNVLLADARPTSTEKQTRNSAGKTSLVEIIHFLLGANCDKDSLFRTDALVRHSFTGVIEVGGNSLTITRTGKEHSKIFIDAGFETADGLVTKTDKETGRAFISNANWRTYLGHAMFRLPLNAEGTAFEEPGAPSFRSLMSYFARRQMSGSFFKPVQHAQQQQRGDWQVNLSYLLGLDWEIPLQFQRIRDREKQLEELKKAARGTIFGQVIGTVAELRPQVAIAELNASKLREQLSHFEVLESYRDLYQRAARAKTQMQALGREAVSLQETLLYLESSLSSESPPERADLQQMYQAAGIELPGIALQRFDDVNRFYSSVIENRRTHLARQISVVRQHIADGDRQMAALDAERREILTTLEGRGALEDFLKLQAELAALEASAATLREKFKTAEALESDATQLEIDRSNLKRRLQEDHREREQTLDRAIIILAETIGELYDDRTGRFVVEATENGPEFRISLEGDRGGGIANMEIFCFDLTLYRVTTKRLGGPGFLIHDSHLFDGVDERQIAKALLLGQRATAGNGQYIVTMNSDIFSRLPLSDEIDPAAVVMPTRLSDETETGGLFGFRFD